ncbi:MAG: LLM class flavin-dependent oxidoreductase [Microthrixaceae bacterium]|nr:LLM class flavin-dependent oxidoreductase [Microthrixaceae bacterium]
MRLGVTIFSTDQTIGVPELAVAAEEHGFDSLWIPEHTHIPTSRLTPPPTGEDELPEEYRRSVDPLVALAAAAALTSRIHLGTGVLLAAQREPIVTAKALATLQNLSGGRLEVGIGFGWNRDEIEQHGVDFARRRFVAREHVLAMSSVVPRRSELPRRVRRHRHLLVVAQAHGSDPDPPRRRDGAEAHGASRRVRRWLDPHRWQRTRRGHPELPRRAPDCRT